MPVKIQPMLVFPLVRGPRAVSYTHLDVYKRQGHITGISPFLLKLIGERTALKSSLLFVAGTHDSFQRGQSIGYHETISWDGLFYIGPSMFVQLYTGNFRFMIELQM